MSDLSTMSPDGHARRLRNLRWADESVLDYARAQTIHGYLPGQVIYNLGEAPLPFSIAPTNYDLELVAELAAGGADLIQFHEDWNDPLRRNGADKFTSHDPAGLTAFVELVHRHGLKLLLYISSGFFDRRDPDFRAEWALPGESLDETFYQYAYCSPGSPGWRAYLLPRLERILDDYGVDGLYNDLGYKELWDRALSADHVSPAHESVDHDAALEDLLVAIYEMVRSRGGITKVHYDGSRVPKVTRRIYDYLWVGEAVEDLDQLRDAVKDHPPYVVPCPDLSRAGIAHEDELYLHAIPYVQFPLRVDGRPFTGERALVPGLECANDDDFWTEHYRRINAWHRTHPDGPHVYNEWDSPTGRAGARERWLYFLALYKPMVTDGSCCWVDVRRSDVLAEPTPPAVTLSLFVNSETYAVIGNFGHEPSRLTTTELWRDREGDRVSRDWTIPARTLLFLQRCDLIR